LSVIGIFRIHYEEDISAFLPQSPETEEYARIYANIGKQDRIAVVFSGDSTHFISAMDCFGSELSEQDTLHMVDNIQVTIDEEQIFDFVQYVWQVYPLLLSDSDYQKLDTMLVDKAYVRKQMEYNHQQIMLPISNLINGALPYDPLHISNLVMGRIQQNSPSGKYKILDGHIFSKDMKYGLVFLTTHFGVSESKQNKQLADFIKGVAQKIENQYPSISISPIGAPIIAVNNASQIKEDSLVAMVLSVLLILALLYYTFRSWIDIVWIGVSIAFGWVLAIGCFGIFYDKVSVIVLGIGSIIVGIAVNYPLHFVNHLRQEASCRSTLKEMVPPLLTGNITTVCAFLCLVFIQAKAIRDLGFLGSLILIGTIAFVLVFLPCLMRKREYGHIYSVLPEINFSIPQGVYKTILPLVLCITLVLGYYSLKTEFDPNIQHINYMTKEEQKNLSLLSSELESGDSTATLFVVTKGDDLSAAVESNEKFLSLIGNNPSIKRISGLNDVFLSDEKQKQRLEKWNSFWTQHQNVLGNLQHESERMGFSSSAFSPFYESCAGKIPGMEDTSPLMEEIGENYVVRDESGTIRIVNILQTKKDSRVKEQLRSTVDETQLPVSVFDNKDISNNLVTILSDAFNYIGFVCGFVVFFFLWFSFERLELSLISFLPLTVSWIWILGVMHLSNIQFNIVNIILATFIFGQGDDYSIFITEGLAYEYTYGKKRLKSYKNSVALSALLMFIGIGTLILAKHPALRSLAEVAMIGMLTVVVMTFYFPPIIFRWLTADKTGVREVPITLKRLVYSLWAITFFLFFSLFIFVPYAVVHKCFLAKNKKCEVFFHKTLQRVSRFVIYRIPGALFRYNNEVHEDFEKPAVIICNHQSHLDVMCLLMMSPKIVILTNDWVWKNPFYGPIIHSAEFYPVSDGMEKNEARLRSLVERGYSVVVFPEGTREFHRSIMHFHKGAFLLAKELKVDILPVMIHGLVDVLPKRDFMLRQGHITCEVRERMPYETLAAYDARELTHIWHQWYVKEYAAMSRRIEDYTYWAPYIRYKYMYKSYGVERECKKRLKEILRCSAIEYIRMEQKIVVPDCGQGEAAWMLALTNPDCEVVAYEEDDDLYAIATNIHGRPSNLTFIRGKAEAIS
jgi:1-acyl-sn-glycerol-3-phosphate acyltransferase